MQFCQVGEFESSKSAMNILAPEFSALITIFRSTGPVISTRRSWISAGTGSTRQSPSRTLLRLGQEVGELAVAQPLRSRLSCGQQLAPPWSELALQLREELDRVVGENVLLVRHCETLDRLARDDEELVGCDAGAADRVAVGEAHDELP